MKRRGAGTITSGDVGQRVLLQAWVQRRRDHGGLIFFDLRDRSGVVQVVLRPDEHPEVAAALAIAVIVLLANGVLQQLVQPIAYGAALELHPLAVLIATIAGGCLFGTIGLILAAPLVSAAVRISAELTAARSSAERVEAAPGQ